MDPSYGARYRALHERHWWWRAREAVVLRELHRRAPPGGWRRALDVGCGDGLLFEALERRVGEIEGVEPDGSLVSEAQRRSGRIHLRPFDRSFRPEHTYDLILFLDVLEHLSDATGAVAHAASLLEPGGMVVVTVPAYRHLWTTHDDLNRHVTRYAAAELRTLLGGSLDVLTLRHFFRWVHAAKLVQRAAESLLRPGPSPPGIPPWPVNRALYALSRAEEALLARAPLPIGSSMLAVARKGE